MQACKDLVIAERGAFECTCLKGHDGDHVFYDLEQNILVAWDNEFE